MANATDALAQPLGMVVVGVLMAILPLGWTYALIGAFMALNGLWFLKPINFESGAVQEPT